MTKELQKVEVPWFGWADERPKGDFERVYYSYLKVFIEQSAKHYRYKKDHPIEATQPMIDGNAFHSIATGREHEVAILPDINRRTKDGKAEYAAFQEANKHKYIISEATRINIDGMCEAISHHKYARKLLESETAQFEIWGAFTDYGTDLPCGIRVDILDREKAIITDLKTCVNASYDKFSKDIFNYGYHFQAAWYRYGFQRIEGHDCDFVLIAVEKEPPYGINTFPIEGRAIQIAEHKIGNALGPLAECYAKDKWPSYPQVFRAPDVPGWALKFD